MIKIFACTCGGVDQLARTVLKEGGHPDWLNVPITKGRQESMRQLEKLKPLLGMNAGYNALYEKLNGGAGKYTIVFGYNQDGAVRWADISRGAIKEMMDAQIIVSEFK